MTPVFNKRNKEKYPFTALSIFQLTKIPIKPISAIKRTIGRLRPSTPRMYVILKDGIHSTLSINCISPIDESKTCHK